MAMVLVIEGGHPSGADLVVSNEARLNPNSRINGGPKQLVRLLDIGDGLALNVEAHVVVQFDSARENVLLLLVGDGGRNSAVAGYGPIPLVYQCLAKVPVAELKENLLATLDGPKVEAAQ